MTKPKESGFDFWRNTLQSCQYVVAPMVDQSELAWRMLSRQYGAQLCYTPMYHSSVFVKDPQYRKDALQTCPEDRPLIIQFCANDPDILLAAATLAEDHCDAIDLNLGCPQMIARRGHYGAFLQDEWELLEKMVSTCHKNLKVPITCKIRILESIERTVEYAKMLEKAGCQLLTVHGRTRDMKGRMTGLANWEYVRAIKKAVNIPVFSNGNIQYLSDVTRCMEETNVDGVMSAEGNLHNPALFAGISPPVWQMCEEYLDWVHKYPCPLSYTRGHVFKILHHALHLHRDIRDLVGAAKSTDDLRKAISLLKERCQEQMKDENFNPRAGLFGELPLPYWQCQPYVRPSPEEEERNRVKREFLKRPLEIAEIMQEKGMSKNKVKKRLRNPYKNFDRKKTVFDMCENEGCNNPRGQKCNFKFCKFCCRKKTEKEVLDCLGKGHRKMAQALTAQGHKIRYKNHPALAKRGSVQGESERTGGETTDKPELENISEGDIADTGDGVVVTNCDKESDTIEMNNASNSQALEDDDPATVCKKQELTESYR